MASAPRVDAATRTWDGGGADNNWSTPANWSSDTLPIAGDTVTFNGTSTKNATIDVPVTVAIFQVNAGYTGTITQNSSLTLTTSYTQSAGTFVGGGAAIGITGSTTVNSGGTFNGGSSPITLTGALTVNAGGAFTSTSGTLTVTGAVTLAAGVFTHNGGTVIFSTSNVTLNLGGAATFNNVQFASGTKTISAANTMTVLGTLTMTAGAVNTGTIAAQGDISVASTFTGGSATLLINGGGAQTWSDALSPTADLPIVNINKAAGTLTMTGTFRTTRNWTWTAGTLNPAGSTVIFAASQTITGSHTLGAVELAGGTINVAAGTTLTVPGTLTLTSGALNQAGATGTIAAQGNITIAAAFTGGSATLLINGSGAQTWSGTANGATNTLLVVNINDPLGSLTLTASLRTTRAWTYTASGGLNASASSIIFAASQTITGSHTLGAVELAGGTLNLAAGTTLTVPGTLTLTSGALNQAGATGTIAAQGNITIAAAFTGGSATLLINGSGAQTWSGTANGATNTLLVVNINDPLGSLTLTASLRTTRAWTYTASGGLNASASSIIFAASQTITGSHTLGAVELAGGTLNLAAGTTLTVPGTLTLTSGALNQAGATGTIAAQGNITIAAAFTGGSATLLINGSGAQTWSGTANGATNTLLVVNINDPLGSLTLTASLRTTRAWTYTASGGLNASASSIIFAASQTITGSHTLGAVELAGGTLNLAAGTTLTVPGTLTLTSGALNQAGATGTIAAQGNITIAAAFTGGSATLLINGSGAQTWSGTANGATNTLLVVNINDPLGSLTLTASLRTTRAWTYTASGGLNASASSIIFAGGTITGSHVLGAVQVAGTVTIAAGTTLTVPGTLTLTSGALNQAGATGTLAAQGNIDAQIGFTGGGSATLLINGSGAQTFTGFHNATTGALPNVVINDPLGTLTLAGTLRTGRNWTYIASGGLIVTGSTVVFTATLTISGNHTLNNVELRAGDVTVTLGDTLMVGGLLTLTDGNLNGGTVEALGNIVLLATYDGETGTFRIAGTTNQTLTGSADTTTSDVANIVIDKPSGTLFLVGTIRLITSSWTWLQGTLDPGSSTVYFDAGVAIGGTHSLFNVYLSGGSHTVASGDTLTALGTLTLDNGTIDGGTVAAAGPISQLAAFDGGSGLLAINGSANRTFTGSATTGLGTLPDLEIDTSGGTLSLAGTIRTTNDWTHLAGAVDADSSLVVFAGTLTIDAGGMSFANVRVNAGTSTLAGNLTLTGYLTVSGGGLDIGSHSVLVGGDVTVDGGLTVTTGLLDLNGLTGQILGGSAPIGLFDLTISNSAGVTQTTSVTVAGTLDLGGPLDFTGQSLSIGNAITGVPNDLTGDATSTLIINGSGSGIVVPASLSALLNLALSNANGAALAGSLTVSGTVILAGGNLDAGGYVLSIGPGGAVNRTTGHVIGALQKWVAAGSGVSVTYEIGDATTYAPVDLTFATVTVTGQLTASTTPGEHPNIGTSPIYPPRDVNRWWALSNAGIGFDTLAVVFTFAPTDVDPGAAPSKFVVAKWDGAWTLPTSGTNTATSITASGMTSLSEFAIGETSALPPPIPTATPLPSPSGSLADTRAGDWDGQVSPTMLLLVFAGWLLLMGALAAESAWRRRLRS